MNEASQSVGKENKVSLLLEISDIGRVLFSDDSLFLYILC